MKVWDTEPSLLYRRRFEISEERRERLPSEYPEAHEYLLLMKIIRKAERQEAHGQIDCSAVHTQWEAFCRSAVRYKPTG